MKSITESKGQFVIDFSPATRKTHPETSTLAEKEITKNGNRKKHCEMILEALKWNNGSTSAELAQYLPLDKEQVHKRMSDLADNEHITRGPKRTCEVKKSLCCTWWIN